jgi:hypothetical protein
VEGDEIPINAICRMVVSDIWAKVEIVKKIEFGIYKYNYYSKVIEALLEGANGKEIYDNICTVLRDVFVEFLSTDEIKSKISSQLEDYKNSAIKELKEENRGRDLFQVLSINDSR